MSCWSRRRGRAHQGWVGIRGDSLHLRDANRHPLLDMVLGPLCRDDNMGIGIAMIDDMIMGMVWRRRIGIVGRMIVETMIETRTDTEIDHLHFSSSSESVPLCSSIPIVITDADVLYCNYLTSSSHYYRCPS